MKRQIRISRRKRKVRSFLTKGKPKKIKLDVRIEDDEFREGQIEKRGTRKR